MKRNYPFDFIQVDSRANIHLFQNGSRGSYCGNVHLKDHLHDPNLKKLKTEFSYSDAKNYVANLKDANLCDTCVSLLYKMN